VTGARYDTIGETYSGTRREDLRLRKAIHGALGAARSVVKVGAGAWIRPRSTAPWRGSAATWSRARGMPATASCARSPSTTSACA
jgi:hypothetical protein